MPTLSRSDLEERGFRHLPVQERVESYLQIGATLMFWLWLAAAAINENLLGIVFIGAATALWMLATLNEMCRRYRAMRETSMFRIFIAHYEAKRSFWTRPFFGVEYHCINKR